MESTKKDDSNEQTNNEESAEKLVNHSISLFDESTREWFIMYKLRKLLNFLFLLDSNQFEILSVFGLYFNLILIN